MSLKPPDGVSVPINSGNRTFRKDGAAAVAGVPTVAVGQGIITWTPVSPTPVNLKFNGTDCSTVTLSLVEAFGAFPIRLSKDKHLNTLWGMMVGAAAGRTPYSELHAALDQYGELELQCL